MQLTESQLESFHRNGFLLLPAFFSRTEVDIMTAQLPELFAEDSPRRVLEKSTNVVRSVYGAHATNEVFQRLTRHPRLLGPAMQILGSSVYVYQFKVNAKLALVGDVWEWHQDFIFWQREDGVENPQLVTISIFLDEVTEFNGPLLFVPESHKEGIFEPSKTGAIPEGYEGSADWIANLTADLKYSIDRDTLARLITRSGIVAPKGPAGSVLFFHCNVAHGSVPNITPFDRRLALITYNRTDNLPVESEKRRPDFLVSRDAKPLVPLPPEAPLA